MIKKNLVTTAQTGAVCFLYLFFINYPKQEKQWNQRCIMSLSITKKEASHQMINHLMRQPRFFYYNTLITLDYTYQRLSAFSIFACV